MMLAFSPSTLGQSLSGGVTTVGIPVGIAIIVFAFTITGVYVKRANGEVNPYYNSTFVFDNDFRNLILTKLNFLK
jgi:uncharacterized membrane protein (DUF485 family)